MKFTPQDPTKTCTRCQGTGRLKQLSHVHDGRCFKCWGEGFVISTADRARSMIQQLEADLVFQAERGKKLADHLAERTPSESMTRELDKYREAYRQTAITVKKLKALLDAPKITVVALKAIAPLA